MSHYKAVVFFDLDGTLLNSTSTLDEEVIQCVTKLKENNVLPVICTGRTDCEIKEISQQAGIDTTITLNGQHIMLNGKELYYHTMDQVVVQRFIDYCQEKGDQVSFYAPEEIYITGIDQTVEECYELIHSPIPELNPSFYQNNDVPMMLVFRNADEIDNEYRNDFPEFEFYRNGPKAMDIVSRGQSKGTGIRILKEALNVSHLPTYAFGDGTNDFAMFAAVDYPVAMGNAVDALKEQAVYITTENTNHGIYNGLKHFNLI